MSTGDEIRIVALEQFSKRGFQATTLRHIAFRVGIQVGSLYNHITSKGDLLEPSRGQADVPHGILVEVIAEQLKKAIGTQPSVVGSASADAECVRARVDPRGQGRRASSTGTTTPELQGRLGAA